MQRSSEGDDATARAAATAAAELLAPVQQLLTKGKDALRRMRHARCLELFERALAAAEALPLSRNSLVLAVCMCRVLDARIAYRKDVFAAAETGQLKETLLKAWRDDEHSLALAQRCLALFYARWRAGTFFTLTLEERAFDSRQSYADDYLSHAFTAVRYWPPLRTPADEAALLHGVHGALRVALDMDARHDVEVKEGTVKQVLALLAALDDADADAGSMLNRLQTMCGLSDADLTALQALAMRDGSVDAAKQVIESGKAKLAGMWERGAADVARHGLRHCALPSCAQTEPHPKCFKLCGRCRGVAYCSAAHAVEDWKRHKRQEGCHAAQ
jgi:hypothetical protein